MKSYNYNNIHSNYRNIIFSHLYEIGILTKVWSYCLRLDSKVELLKSNTVIILSFFPFIYY